MIIFYCNTYYQLINALQLSLTEFQSGKKCFLLDSKLNLADQIVKKLTASQIADYAFKVTDHYDTWRIWMYSTPLRKRYESRFIEMFEDECGFECLMQCKTYLFANIGGPALCLAAYLKQRLPGIQLAMYEDGVSSYSRIFGDMVLQMLHPSNMAKRIVNSIFGTPYQNLVAYYVFLPELIVWDCPYLVKQISPIHETHEEIKTILNMLFDYASQEERYEEKVVFFEESYHTDGVDVNDLAVVKKLAERYGKDEIIVKLHPRSKQNRFHELGYHTNVNSAIPWEVIALNLPLADKVLATISSTALLSSFLLSDGMVKMLFCYQHIDYKSNQRLKYTIEVIQKLETLYPDMFIRL